MTRASFGASAVLALALIASFAGACGKDREATFDGPGPIVGDASSPDACPFQCSLDGRQVVDACTGNVIQTCPEELACGAAICQHPCAAAAADRSSNGCDFYFQMPRYTTFTVQSCYAAFIVNTSIQPVDVALEYQGRRLDTSKAIFAATAARGNYEYRRVDLARNAGPGETFGSSTCQNGLQRLRSDGPFTATVWGWDVYSSYAHPGGMAQRKLVMTPMAPIR